MLISLPVVPWTLRPKFPREDAGSTVPLPPNMVVPLVPYTIEPTPRPLLLALGGLFTIKLELLFK
jgi:hypothetical protein